MKRISMIALAASIALFGFNATAVAEGHGAKKGVTASWKAENKAKVDAYKLALKTYQETKKANQLARKAIGEKFKADADALRANTKSAVKSAVDAEAKSAAAAAGKAALAKLIADRKAALAALPNPGERPVKPVLAPRPAK